MVVAPLLRSKNGVLRALGVCELERASRGRTPSIGELGRAMAAAEHGSTEILAVLLAVLLERWQPAQGAPRMRPLKPWWPPTAMDEEGQALICRVLVDYGRGHGARLTPLLADVCPNATDASFLRSWCVAQLVERLPLRGTAAPDDSRRRFSDADWPLTTVAAAQIWRLHGDGAPDWYRQRVYDARAFGRLRQPLLRAADYHEWSQTVEGLVWALVLGAHLVAVAPERSIVRAATVAGLVSAGIRRLGSELWRFNDLHGLLPTLLWHLGRSARAPGCLPEVIQLCREIAASAIVPGCPRVCVWLAAAPRLLDLGDELIALMADANVLRPNHIPPKGLCDELRKLISDGLRGREMRSVRARAELQPMLRWLTQIGGLLSGAGLPPGQVGQWLRTPNPDLAQRLPGPVTLSPLQTAGEARARDVTALARQLHERTRNSAAV